MILKRLNHMAMAAARRSDVIIVMFMLMAIVMIIIPLPTWLVDALIALNISLSILILIGAFYIAHSVEFSALPPLILLSTLFRLSLSITTTRLILLDGNAGHIVKAFGDFVIAGQVVVGLVVFLIITVAQFVVITKGAERVAEVAARFTLDAMPGKQMSIDNDLRNGDIDQPEARRRRARLERESQMFGAMDGAMKFVKGDAIAGLVILAVNLLGGMLIGMLERDMAFADAVHAYSLLTVGDGLIAQIPALLISVAAGTVVTRVNSDGAQANLGAEILQQLGASHSALGLTALILLGVAWLPGFPALAFVLLAAVLGGASWVTYRRGQVAPLVAAEALDDLPSTVELLTPAPILGKPSGSRLLLIIGSGLAQLAPEHALGLRLEALSHEVHGDLGIDFPTPQVYVDPHLGAQHFVIELEGVPVSEGDLLADCLLLQDDPVHVQLLGIDLVQGSSPLSSRTGHWIDDQHQARLEDAGVGFLCVDDVLRAAVSRTLRRYAGDFLGIQETRVLLERLEDSYGELVKEALRVVPLQRTAEVLRLLVGEGVSIRNQRALLEAMVDAGAGETDAPRLAEHLRVALARQISHQFADRNRVISAFVLAPALEGQLRSDSRLQGSHRHALPESTQRELLTQLRKACEGLPDGHKTVLLVHPELRRSLRRLVLRGDLELAVLSFRELAGEYNLQAIAAISLPEPNPRRSDTAAPLTAVVSAS
nr:type III secretion system export apparatus subunit SctV [uncultured Pseudomonas sp.]